MLPIVLVLLVATSALAAPSLNLSYRPINEVAPPRHNGGIISAFFTDQALAATDNADIPAYVIYAMNIVNDLANQGDRSSQALAVAQVIAILANVAPGIPGDACAAASAIDAYVNAARSGNPGAARGAIRNFIQQLSSNIDLIVQLVNNPNSLRYTTGSRGNCQGGGRNYQFEAAWDFILGNTIAAPGLVNEQYCAAKRMFNAPSARTNNVGTVLTAASLPPVNKIFQAALEEVARFVQSIPSGNVGGSAGAAKRALASAAANVGF